MNCLPSKHYLVFDRLDSKSPKVDGLLLVILYWRDYFDGLLPPGADGVVVILENDCGQVKWPLCLLFVYHLFINEAYLIALS